MPRAGLAYERSSRVSQALIAGFSLAVAVMAGWLVLMIMSSHDGNTTTADTADLSPPVKQPPRVENLPPARPSIINRVSPLPEATPWPDQAASLPLSGPTAAPVGTTPTTAYATSSLTTSRSLAPTPVTTTSLTPNSLTTPGIVDRVAPADDPAVQTETAPTAIVPLPPPRPRRVVSIPIPRPRPQIDEPAEPAQRSLFDYLVDRQR
jgi:hypothetical protein